MTTPLADTWHARDLPVLREYARQLEANSAIYAAGVRVHEVADALGIDPVIVIRATHILEDEGLLQAFWVQPQTHGRVTSVSGRARQLVGQWPSQQLTLDRIIAALEAIAASTDDEDERTKAQKFAAWLGAGATTVGLSVATAAITGQLPGQQ